MKFLRDELINFYSDMKERHATKNTFYTWNFEWVFQAKWFQAPTYTYI